MLSFSKYSRYWSLYHSRYRYYTSREEYYTNLIAEKTPNQLLSLGSNQARLYHTDEILQFNGLTLGSPQQDIIRQLGQAKFSWKNPLFRQHHAKVFRLNIHHIFCYVTLHFIQGNLFTIDTIFKNLSGRNTDRILNILKDKYLPEYDVESFEGVVDASGNCLFLEKNHYLSVKYVAGNPTFRVVLTDAVQQKQKRRTSFELKLNTALAEYL
ncbi:MAG: hypothetical protein AAF944_18870 [Bacteroidota bacterium]